MCASQNNSDLTPLLNKSGSQSSERREIHVASRWSLSLTLTAVAIVAVLTLRNNDYSLNVHNLLEAHGEHIDDYQDTIDWHTSNTYDALFGRPGEAYSGIVSERIVEPGRLTTITIKSSDYLGRLMDCSWNIERIGTKQQRTVGANLQKEQEEETPNVENLAYSTSFLPLNMTGLQINVKFGFPGEYIVTAQCIAHDGSFFQRSQQHSCRYVRRELRRLTDEDRLSFLNAIATMKKTITPVGQRIYGPNYKCVNDFVIEHLWGATDMDTDHIHDGMGVATQHISLSNEFELAMQSVDSSVALPYWDPTVDGSAMQKNYGDRSYANIVHSELFSDKWFGASSDDTGNHVVSGQWAYETVGKKASTGFKIMEGLIPDRWNFSVNLSPFGYLRAPWNINPSPYVTRYHKNCGAKVADVWPTCATHWHFTNSMDYSTWYEWAFNIGYLPHGPIHSWVGGIGGFCDSFSELEGLLTNEEIINLKQGAFGLLKNAYRDKYVQMPAYCTTDSEEECIWACALGLHQRDDDDGIRAQSFDLIRSTIQGITTDMDDLISTGRAPPDSAARTLYSFEASSLATETPDNDDNTESTSHSHRWNESDIDKILQKVYCDTKFWPGDHLEAASPVETSFWVIHPTLDRLMQYKVLAMPWVDSNWTSGSSTCTAATDCLGHNPEDLTFWTSVMKSPDGGEFRKAYTTNEELRRLLDPRVNYSLPYIYDDFKWPHCAKDGWPFKEV